MPDIPTETVTFVFTDIVGSTRLWEQHPEAMRLALARHDFILQSAIEQHNGRVFKTVGDAFYAAFADAQDAAAAALAAQRALCTERWQSEIPLIVRIALHTGAAEQRAGDYFGSALNRIARLLAIGHGGQILLSGSTQERLGDRLPEDAALIERGSHRLKDLQHPERVWQLTHPALITDNSPLASLDLAATNLPVQSSSFIGREQEMRDIERLLATTRLLTLTGSGGTGKTRLMLQVAADLVGSVEEGVWLVELASLGNPALVPQAVAQALSIHEEPGRPLLQTLTDTLRTTKLLLLIDNCEHLLGAVAQLTDVLLKQCPGVRILASSRENLGIAGEQTYRVPSLSLPDQNQSPTVASVMRSESVGLFATRARAALPAFEITDTNAPTLARLCRRLDGIPLALELAAARVRALSVEQIEARLHDRFRLLVGGNRAALPRQQTLRALIDWSYDLLTAPEKTLLCRLSVFAGGASLKAVERVCAQTDSDAGSQKGALQSGSMSLPNGGMLQTASLQSLTATLEGWEVLDMLLMLVDKSLVIYEERGGASCYRLLETVRQYARDRLLESGEAAQIRSRYALWCREFTIQTTQKMGGSEQSYWLDMLETEHDNLRAALDYCLESPEMESTGLTMAGALSQFWWTRGHMKEGKARLLAALARPAAQEPTVDRAHALLGAGTISWMQGDALSACPLLEESLLIYRQVDCKVGIAAALGNLGIAAKDRGDFAAAGVFYSESLAFYRELGEPRHLAFVLVNMGILAEKQRDYAAAHTLYEESLLLRRQSSDKEGMALSLGCLGYLDCILGDYTAARTHLIECLQRCREVGSRLDAAYALESFALLERQSGTLPRAATLYGAAAALRTAIHAPLPPDEQRENEVQITLVRDSLGTHGFAEANEKGAAMTMLQAIAFALGDSDHGELSPGKFDPDEQERA